MGAKNPSSSELGDCFDVHGRLAMDAQYEDIIKLVHGVVIGQGEVKGLRYAHAWLEYTQMIHDTPLVTVMDCSNGREIILPKEYYYHVGKIPEGMTVEYSPQEARMMMLKYGDFGPWELNWWI